MSSRSSLHDPSNHLIAHISPSLSALADPPNREIDSAVMDYLLIEMVRTLRESAAVATARRKAVEQEMINAGLIPPPTQAQHVKKESARDSTTSLSSIRATPKSAVDEEEEPLRTRLEAIGIHAGANYAERLCRDRPTFAETLDAIKFICKDVWAACWNKQVDNLRTNHRGVYVLQDNAFKPISRISSPHGRADAIKRAKIYAAIGVGVIRGVLSRLGISGTVTSEVASLPQCTFQIKLPKSS